MKIRFIALLFIAALMIKCEKEDQIIVSDASFEIENASGIYAFVPVNINISGEGQKYVFWPGDESHVWTDSINHTNSGIQTNNSKSITYTYNTPGIYTITCIASSTGNYGEDFNQDIKHQEIEVSDDTKEFKAFSFFRPKAEGVIVNDSIFIEVCTSDDITGARVDFKLISRFSSVFINGVPQVSRVTSNDFTKPITYTIVAYDGSEKNYPVIVSVVECN